ncbi:exodeoxyribonuclease III [Dictyocaulus viviparus]|uniref:DNA-(apurinic or apyrimidinic site) endonuclease n=1 Tax=Dictyocaulus viviparus TaxID=29172 RepID=A0A0D8XFL5_DICVI|nr:exodeoxyribonuclease III [Dictyocaulus viviparus]
MVCSLCGPFHHRLRIFTGKEVLLCEATRVLQLQRVSCPELQSTATTLNAVFKDILVTSKNRIVHLMVKRSAKTDFFKPTKRKAPDVSNASESSQENGCNDAQERFWRLLSWNVAGLRACCKKRGHESILSESADVIFLGEIKCSEWPVDLEKDFKDYSRTLVTSKEKKGGYAGVALLSKTKPMKVWKGIGDSAFDNEGRLITAEFQNFYFIGAYVPNSGRGLINLEKRGKWEQLILNKIKELDQKKPVIYAGDLNVAHNEIDLANPEANRNKTAGFTDQERGWFTKLLGAGFKDTYREMHQDKREYSFWSYMGNARAKNVGWRLDYFVVSERIFEKVKSSKIRGDVMGSDHAPIVLEINI